jgi:hypothetical protein
MNTVFSFKIRKPLIIALVLVVFGAMVQYALATSAQSASGWAWGGGVDTNPVTMDPPANDNPPGYQGMGWISFNSTDCNTDDSADDSNDNIDCGLIGSTIGRYGVDIPSSNGNLSGYAWSEHYGWISFNGADLAGCAPVLLPAARSGNDITGGARVVSICDGNGDDDCRDVGVDNLFSNSGGFDGCISLSGPGYGLTVNPAGGLVNGYAWSSDFGWINFSGNGGIVTYTNPGFVLTVTPAGAGGGTITSAPVGINCGADCSETYAVGTVVNLTAIPNGTSQFSSWSGCDSTSGNVCTVTVNAVKNVIVTFDAFCPGATVSNCILPNAPNGNNNVNGVCAPTYVGACNYSCNVSTWNANSNTCVVAPLPPNIVIEATPQLIRSGDITTVTITTTSANPLRCDIYGATATPMMNQSLDSVTPITFPTKPINNKQLVSVTCTDTMTSAVGKAEAIIEVLPKIQEI